MSRVLLVLVSGFVLVPMGSTSGRIAAPVPADPPFSEEVLTLLSKLNESDADKRQEAIHQLRLLARRVDVAGAKRERRGQEHAPKVKGLVPHLIRAAGDEAEANRTLALYALADTLDPAAVVAIRERLQKDKSEAVRFNAACLLTEFKDVSGLDELKSALARLRGGKPDTLGSFDIERLLASFERATGKSFGPIPMNPLIASDTRVIEASLKKYQELLDAWAAWWDWKPPAK
jgi:HEAT repeat protein